MKRRALLLAFSVLFGLLTAEVVFGVGTRAGLFPIRLPSYSLAVARKPRFWTDSNPHFGVWHEPNASVRHTLSCVDVNYHSNSYGARDAERALDSRERRVVVLGDSLVEGFGMADGHRFSDLLERKTGIEHLNFGSSGNFGTTQYYLVYETLARRFAHDAVIIGMLPDNDFWDNDYEFGQQLLENRYRPYFVGEHPNYRLVYFQATMNEGVTVDRPSGLELAERILGEFSYSYNALAHLWMLARIGSSPVLARAPDERAQEFFRGKGVSVDPSRPYSGYYDYRQDQLDLVKYTFERIRQRAGGREVVIVLLPLSADFQRYDPSAPPPLSRELERFAAARGITLLDLLPLMHRHTKDWSSYFLSCDGHWSARGHAVAALYTTAKLAPLYQHLRD